MKLENAVARLDREWQLARERYMIAGQYGNRYIPSRGVSVLMGVVVTGFGIFWIAMAMSITSNMPGIGGAFPCFGVIFILFGVGMSIYSFSKATQYEEEYQRYQQRRAELLAGRSEERSMRRAWSHFMFSARFKSRRNRFLTGLAVGLHLLSDPRVGLIEQLRRGEDVLKTECIRVPPFVITVLVTALQLHGVPWAVLAGIAPDDC